MNFLMNLMIAYVNEHDTVSVVQSVPRICVYFDVLLKMYIYIEYSMYEDCGYGDPACPSSRC